MPRVDVCVCGCGCGPAASGAGASALSCLAVVVACQCCLACCVMRRLRLTWFLGAAVISHAHHTFPRVKRAVAGSPQVKRARYELPDASRDFSLTALMADLPSSLETATALKAELARPIARTIVVCCALELRPRV
jgi:hypothetical protein